MKFYYIFFFLLTPIFSKAQEFFFEILITKTDSTYYNFIEKLSNFYRTEQKLTIEPSLDNAGNKILTTSIPLEVIDKIGFSTISTLYQRINKIEYCIEQHLICIPSFSIKLIEFIKDRFIHKDEDWIYPLFEDFYIKANFRKLENSKNFIFSFYTIKEGI